MKSDQAHFKELEYKYRADEVKLQDFEELMDSLKDTHLFKKKIDASSWDVYFTKEDDDAAFQRYRMSSDRPELTKKRKVKTSNNWERIEVDLPLDPDKVNEAIVSKFVGLDGYTKNFKIFKSCFIYFFEQVNFVWYIVQDENMNEKGRFIEVEINKDKVKELGENAFEVLKKFEQELNKLNLTHQNRLKKSLFEMYKK